MKTKLGVIFLLCVFVLAGCLQETHEQYEFRQGVDQIQKIEIVKQAEMCLDAIVPVSVEKEFEPDEFQMVVDAIMELDGGRVALDPPTGFGLYQIRITYADGEIEIIGNYSKGYISCDGVLHEEFFSLDKEQYYKMISEFLGKEITGDSWAG